jgi:predicted ATPase
VSGEAPVDVGSSGEQTIHALWSASRKASTRPVYRRVNEWLRKLGLASELRFKRISPTQFTVEVKDATTGVVTGLADVGFGLSQILPALVQLQLMAEGGTLLVEQPEIHLHPRLQTELGDVLIESVGAGRQIIVETHSELLLSRIQRRMAEASIDPRLVSVLYFEMTPMGSVVRQLEFDAFGNFKEPLPMAFFSEEFIERTEQTKAEARRRQQEGEAKDPSPVS